MLLGKSAFAFDPLLSEKGLPNKPYDFFSDEKKLIEKSCDDFISGKDLGVFEAINIGLCNNPSTKISWLLVKKQAAIYGLTKSSYLPTATITSSKNSSKTVTQLSGKNSNNYTSNGISIDWLLYDFGSRSAKLERDYFLLIQAAQTHNENLQTFIYQIIAAYSNLAAAQETLKASVISEESNKLAFDVVSKKFSVGLVPKADVLKIESNYSQATLARQKAENSVANYLGSFLQILNLKQGQKLKLKSPSFAKASDFLELDVQKLIDQALANRPDLKAIIAKEKSYKADLRSTNLERFPKITISANQSYSDVRNDYNQRSSGAAINLTYNFFTGFNQTYLASQSRYNYESTAQERLKLENQIAYDVWSAMQNLKTAKETEITARKLLKSAEASREVTLGMYKVGKGSVVDIITAESVYANAMKEVILAKYNKFSSEAAILLALGELNKSLSANQFDEIDENKVQ